MFGEVVGEGGGVLDQPVAPPFQLVLLVPGAGRVPVEALERLKSLGYGTPGSGRVLDLVYNPLGASLPPPQAELEARYRDELSELFGIVFDRLFTLTNMPIKRFAHTLVRDGQHEAYLSLRSTTSIPRR